MNTSVSWRRRSGPVMLISYQKRSVKVLTENWGKMGLTWMQNDVLGCLIPNKPGKALGKSM